MRFLLAIIATLISTHLFAAKSITLKEASHIYTVGEFVNYTCYTLNSETKRERGGKFDLAMARLYGIAAYNDFWQGKGYVVGSTEFLGRLLFLAKGECSLPDNKFMLLTELFKVDLTRLYVPEDFLPEVGFPEFVSCENFTSKHITALAAVQGYTVFETGGSTPIEYDIDTYKEVSLARAFIEGFIGQGIAQHQLDGEEVRETLLQSCTVGGDILDTMHKIARRNSSF